MRLVLFFVVLIFAGCRDYQVGMSSKLPVIDAETVVRTPDDRNLGLIQIYGRLTVVDENNHKWILDDKILLKDLDPELVRGLQVGDMILVRGYLERKNVGTVSFLLKHAYYSPCNKVSHEVELAKIDAVRKVAK